VRNCVRIFKPFEKGTVVHKTGFLPALAFCLVLATLSGTPTWAQKVLKTDPPPGTLYTGTSVLVDDGSCPKGQIKKLTRVGSMSDREGGFRKQECVAYRK
jgi:hypothetical protein